MDQWLTSYPRRHALNVRKPRPWVQGPEHSSGRVERFLQVRRPQRPVAPRPCITSTLHRPFVCTAGPGPADGIVVRLCVCMCGRGGGRKAAAARGGGAGRQGVDEDPYTMPAIDESKWMSGGHLGGQMQTTNWAVVNCTTPANYFHVLRRQVLRAPPPPPAPAPTCLCEAILRELS